MFRKLTMLAVLAAILATAASAAFAASRPTVPSTSAERFQDQVIRDCLAALLTTLPMVFPPAGLCFVAHDEPPHAASE